MSAVIPALHVAANTAARQKPTLVHAGLTPVQMSAVCTYVDGEVTAELNRLKDINFAAFTQSGFLTLPQLLAAGYDRPGIDRLIQLNVIEKDGYDSGLYRLSGWPDSHNDEYVRWSLWSSGYGVISDGSALDVHNLTDYDTSQTTMSVPAGFESNKPCLKLVVRNIEKHDVMQCDGFRVTTPLKTILDISETMRMEFINQAVTEAIDRGIVTPNRLRARYPELSQPAIQKIEMALGR